MDAVTVVIIVYLSVMLLISIVGNSSTILIILLNRDMRSTNNFFILNLAVSDLIFSVVATPLRFIHMFGGVVTLEFCKTALFFGMFFFHSSVAGLVTLSVDRYICITRPLHYQGSLLKRKANVVMVIGWFFSLFISLLPLTEIAAFQPKIPYEDSCRYATIMSKNYLIFLIVTTEFVTTCVVIILYGHIFVVANRHARKIQEENRIRKSVNKWSEECSVYPVEAPSGVWYQDEDSDLCQPYTKSRDNVPQIQVQSSCKPLLFNICCNFRSKAKVLPLPQSSPAPDITSYYNRDTTETNKQSHTDIAVIHSKTLSQLQICPNQIEGSSGSFYSHQELNQREDSSDNDRHSLGGHLPSENEAENDINNSAGKKSVTILQPVRNGNAILYSRGTLSSLKHSSQGSDKKKRKRRRLLRSFKREYKAAKLIAAVVGLFMICVLPIAFIDMLELTNTAIKVPVWVVNVAICLVSTNPAVNSILYAIGKKDFRVSYYKLWTCGKYTER